MLISHSMEDKEWFDFSCLKRMLSNAACSRCSRHVGTKTYIIVYWNWKIALKRLLIYLTEFYFLFQLGTSLTVSVYRLNQPTILSDFRSQRVL